MGVTMAALSTMPVCDPHAPDRGGCRTGDIVIIGCGRSHRRDDQVGLRVADLLAGAAPPWLHVLRSEAPGTDLLTEAIGAQLLVIVDSAAAGPSMPAGRWKRFVCADDGANALERTGGAGPHMVGHSSHLLGVLDALRLGLELGLLPGQVWVYAVAADDFGYGDEMSQEVNAAALGVAAAIVADVAAWKRSREGCRA